MKQSQTLKLSNKALKVNQFKQEVAKLNDSDIDNKMYDARLIELYEIYNNENEINNIEIWD